MLFIIGVIVVLAYDFMIYACCVSAYQADEAMDEIMNGV